jgi:hypothetical protein
MFITTDLSYSSIDTYTIVKGLVDHWQNKTYGDYGIDTSGIGTSGNTRTIKYWAKEAPMVHAKIAQLADNVDGFEYRVEPGTRDLILESQRGTDLSASVILDHRSITSPNAHFSVAQGHYANHAIAIGADVEGTTPVIGEDTNATEFAIWGRAGVAIGVDGVTQQATIDNYSQMLLEATDRLHFVPGVGTVYPVLGADVTDFDAGDKITWNYDYGLGNFSVARDVYRKWVKFKKTGEEEMSVEFL